MQKRETLAQLICRTVLEFEKRQEEAEHLQQDNFSAKKLANRKLKS
ncbi:MAG: hypothetical protein AAF378_03140 [Cyanobacteria bacterium P01_A01_bin.84]